jgi:hypothetical protein
MPAKAGIMRNQKNAKANRRRPKPVMPAQAGIHDFHTSPPARNPRAVLVRVKATWLTRARAARP